MDIYHKNILTLMLSAVTLNLREMADYNCQFSLLVYYLGNFKREGETTSGIRYHSLIDWNI